MEASAEARGKVRVVRFALRHRPREIHPAPEKAQLRNALRRSRPDAVSRQSSINLALGETAAGDQIQGVRQMQGQIAKHRLLFHLVVFGVKRQPQALRERRQPAHSVQSMGRVGGDGDLVVLLLVVFGIHQARCPIHHVAGKIQAQLGAPGKAIVAVGSVYAVHAPHQILVEQAPVFRIDHAGDGGELQVVPQIMLDADNGDEGLVLVVFLQVVAEVTAVVRPEARPGVYGLGDA